jgi:hypothetical protein
MSQIAIQRAKSRWQDRNRDYKVIVDGREVARVGNGEAATVGVEPGRHTVYMAIDWGRSKPLEVTVAPEQAVQLECGPNVKPFLALVYAVVLFRRWVWLRPANGAVF